MGTSSKGLAVWKFRSEVVQRVARLVMPGLQVNPVDAASSGAKHRNSRVAPVFIPAKPKVVGVEPACIYLTIPKPRKAKE